MVAVQTEVGAEVQRCLPFLHRERDEVQLRFRPTAVTNVPGFRYGLKILVAGIPKNTMEHFFYCASQRAVRGHDGFLVISFRETTKTIFRTARQGRFRD